MCYNLFIAGIFDPNKHIYKEGLYVVFHNRRCGDSNSFAVLSLRKVIDMKKKYRKLFVIALAVAVLLMPMTAFGASHPYKDVTKKSVGKRAYKAIKYNKEHQAYKDVVTGKYFHPRWKIRRGEFIIILTNCYGSENVPVTENDKQKWNILPCRVEIFCIE